MMFEKPMKDFHHFQWSPLREPQAKKPENWAGPQGYLVNPVPKNCRIAALAAMAFGCQMSRDVSFVMQSAISEQNVKESLIFYGQPFDNIPNPGKVGCQIGSVNLGGSGEYAEKVIVDNNSIVLQKKVFVRG